MPLKHENKTYYTKAEAARYFKVTEATILSAIRSEKLKGQKINNKWVISIQSFKEYESFRNKPNKGQAGYSFHFAA